MSPNKWAFPTGLIWHQRYECQIAAWLLAIYQRSYLCNRQRYLFYYYSLYSHFSTNVRNKILTKYSCKQVHITNCALKVPQCYTLILVPSSILPQHYNPNKNGQFWKYELDVTCFTKPRSNVTITRHSQAQSIYFGTVWRFYVNWFTICFFPLVLNPTFTWKQFSLNSCNQFWYII
jgi:hypothetical protein